MRESIARRFLATSASAASEKPAALGPLAQSLGANGDDQCHLAAHCFVFVFVFLFSALLLFLFGASSIQTSLVISVPLC